jgi:hypothetical protein
VPIYCQFTDLRMATSVPETEPDVGHNGDEAELDEKPQSRLREDGKYELLDSDAWEVLGYSFPTWRKWQILFVVFLIQISMNLNASMYANAVDGITEKFHVSKQAARVPQMTFLVAYGKSKHSSSVYTTLTLYQPLGVNCGHHGVRSLAVGLSNN